MAARVYHSNKAKKKPTCIQQIIHQKQLFQSFLQSCVQTIFTIILLAIHFTMGFNWFYQHYKPLLLSIIGFSLPSGKLTVCKLEHHLFLMGM